LSLFKKNKKNRKKSSRFFKKSDKTIKKSFFKPFLLILLVSLIFGFIYTSINQPLTSIKIEGDLKRVSTKRVDSIVSEIMNQGFLTINQSKYKDRLENIDWVKSVRINKEWPNKINILLIEDDVVGLWNQKLLLNSSGELYNLDQRIVPKELIQFSGPDDRVNDVYEKFNIYNNELVTRGILIEKIELNLRGSWEITIRPSITIKLGGEDTQERFERFLTIWDQSLLENFELISYIDLRYTEGFSIKRKNQ
tara:strand:+ start:275 stop:1027 length:753 start_codon:yes stop_codon:yes gene_type:complete